MLTISREDVTGDVITEFTSSERFLKLPIVPYLKLLPSPMGKATVFDEINRPQKALINAINSPNYRFVVAALARRLGKTYIANIVGQLVTLMPGSSVLVISPNYSLSSISFDLQRALISQFDLEVDRNNVKDKVIELSNKSTIRMGSVNNVDSSVGRSYNLIIFDEAALDPKGDKAFNILRPTLDRPNSKAIFISTPRGQRNWFAEFFRRGYNAKHPEWVSIWADYSENKRMSSQDVEEARSSMSEAEFQQEYMANFNVYEGQIYNLVQNNAIVKFEDDGTYEFFGGLDPGYRDPCAFVIIAYSHSKDEYHIVTDYEEKEKTTSAHVEKIREIMGEYKVFDIFCDSAAAQFRADLAYEHDITTIPAIKDVLAGIGHVQSLLEAGKLKVDPSCTKTIDSFDQYRWDDKEGLVKEKPHHDFSHIPDAVRYAIHTYRV